MKKYLFAALIAVTMGTSAFAASPVKMYKVSGNSFNADFKNATNVSWTSGSEYVKATFLLDNVKMEAFYNMSGELIGTSKSISPDELTANAKRSFAKKFEGFVVKESIRFEGVDGAAYYISAENDKASIIVKINDNNSISVIKNTTK